jgi:predicted nucleic acid-binding protein
MSVVSRGELISLGYKRKWGNEKKAKLGELLRKIPQVDINTDSIMQMYGEIDAFSQGCHPTKILSMTARNMGKNDLWIAATVATTNTTLITTDSDFDHLDKVFFSVIKIDPKIKK